MQKMGVAASKPDFFFADEALATAIKHCDFDTVLDVGSGGGKHADAFEENGKRVTCIDYGKSIYFKQVSSTRTEIVADYLTYEFEEPFDLLWASHVLEHQPNPNIFLKKMHQDIKEGGWLVVTVPPLKHEIVGGHVTLWNAGLLLYQLIMAGFNCKNAWIKSYGYNISVIVQKKTIKEMPELAFDSGDIDRLGDYFPDGLTERFDGAIKNLNWPE